MRKNQSAFTLLEIMLVVTIIALLLGAAIYRMAPAVDVAKMTRVSADLSSLRTALLSYSGMNGFYPSTEQGIQALVTQPAGDPVPQRWMRFMDTVPKDPWGSDYIYRCPGQKNPTGYDLYSAGPDRLADTPDDVWGS